MAYAYAGNKSGAGRVVAAISERPATRLGDAGGTGLKGGGAAKDRADLGGGGDNDRGLDEDGELHDVSEAIKHYVSESVRGSW